MIRYILHIILLIFFLNSQPIFSQETKTVTAGDIYKAGWLHRQIFGDNWRDAWTTPIEAPVLNLKTFAGGLKPLRRGGGFQTKSLRLLGQDGKQYKFRSIEKFTEKLLDKQLLNTIIEVLTKDMFSTSNPFAAFVASPIINSVGILQSEPILVILPDDDSLGEFREEFAGLLGTIELHPDDYPEESDSFADADKVFGSYKLFDKTLKDNDFRVDSREFLKARILDIYMGDWDRHYDQWRWAAYKSDGITICRPIPRDRDQAFCRYEGLVGFLVDEVTTQIEDCDETYPKIEDLTWSGRYLDRKYLTSLNKSVWDSIANVVVESITDSVIDYAVNRLPKELLNKDGDRLRNVMISRRELLKEASGQYYRNISKYPDIRASNKSEIAEINRLDDGLVEISLYKRDKITGDKKGKPFFNRTFDDDETKDIKLYMLGGDDKIVINGEVDNSILLHIDGGNGKDEFIDNSIVRGYFLGLIPFIPDDETMAIFYDNGKRSKYDGGSSSSFDNSDYPIPDNDTLLFEPPVRDWGHDWRSGVWFTLNSDDGLFVGGGPILYEFDFRSKPYVYKQSLFAGYATILDGFRLQYILDMPELFKPFRFYFDAYASSIDITHYYGLGNENKLVKDPDESDFYKVELEFIYANPRVEWNLNRQSNLTFGANFKYANNNLHDSSFINIEKPIGSIDQKLLIMNSQFVYDTRNHPNVPQKGFFLNIDTRFSPKIFPNNNEFSKAEIDLRFYKSIDFITDVTLAARINGSKIWGKAPYFEMSYIGGYGSLRGYNRLRFAGDAHLLSNLEIRFHAIDYKFIIPGKIGLMAFTDVGRVYLNGEKSDKWHKDYGGGFSLSFINDEYLLSFYVAKSIETTAYHINYGFMF